MSPSQSPEFSQPGNIDFLIRQAWKIYKSLTSAPEELRDLQDAALSVYGSLRLVCDYIQTSSQLAPSLAETLQDHLERVQTVILSVENELENLRQQRTSIDVIAKLARKVIIQGARLSSFYEVLRRDPQAQLMESLKSHQQKHGNMLSSEPWNVISTELLKAGHSRTAVEEDYFITQISLQQQKNIHHSPQAIESQSSTDTSEDSTPSKVSLEVPQRPNVRLAPEASSSSAGARLPSLSSGPLDADELPGYDPTTKPTTTAEKVHNLEQTTAILDAEAAIENAGSSNMVDPPAYTFDEGNDTEMDEDFSRYIQKAIAFELKRRYQARQIHPKQGPFVYSWLPPALQTSFAGRDDIVTLLDAKSFTVMAYETGPRTVQELDSLLPVLRLSADGSGDDTIFSNAVNTIKVMEKALSKLTTAQHPNPGGQFSDIDALDYEYDTARAVDSQLSFPSRHFDFAQKSFYNLLTYIMGMTDLLKDMFNWQTLVQRSREELTLLWEERRISARTAWIEKQLAGWSSVDDALLACRDWQALRNVRGQAIAALQAWQRSVGMLHSTEPPEIIYLNIMSATGLAKSRTYQCETVLYAAPPPHQRPSWEYRHFQEQSTISQKSQQPSFNQTLHIKLPERPRMLDIMLTEVGLRGKEIGRVRLKFNDIPGVERTLDGKDLFYGYDEQLAVSIPLSEAAKGKEVEAPVLLFRLAWKGRYTYVEAAGLPLSPPGKMFRSNRSHIPTPFPGQAELAAVAGILNSVSS